MKTYIVYLLLTLPPAPGKPEILSHHQSLDACQEQIVQKVLKGSKIQHRCQALKTATDWFAKPVPASASK